MAIEISEPEQKERVRVALWAQLMAVAGSVYVVIHLGAFILERLLIVPPHLTLLSLPWDTLVQITKFVGAIGAAAMVAGRAQHTPADAPDDVFGEGEVTSAIVDPWLADLTRQTSGLQLHQRSTMHLIKDLSLLYEIGQGISATIELPELLHRVTELLQARLDLREFAVLLFDDEEKYLQVKGAYGFQDSMRITDMIFQVGEGICGEVAQSGEPIYVDNVEHDPRYLAYRGEIPTEGALFSVPLRFKREILGVVNYGRAGVDSFSQADRQLLTLISNQISLAIANARLYSKTRELAVRDDLTGLYNRRHFLEVLQVEWKRAQRFRRGLALLMIDVDHFKHFNDDFGHLHGDQVLRQIAETLRRNLREVDTFARFGGEEFIALLSDTDRKGAFHVGEKLRRIVEGKRFSLPNQTDSHPLTISIGVSVFPDDALQLDDLVDHADIALYDAKDAGRNQVVAYATLPEDAQSQDPAQGMPGGKVELLTRARDRSEKH
jgi:diguanylate cyclase (GGDEF)-like protein